MSPEQGNDLEHLRHVLELERDRLRDDIKYLRERTDTAATVAAKALDKALEANEKRLDALNELRQMSADRDANFATRDKLDAVERALLDRMEGHNRLTDSRLKALETRSSGQIGWGAGAAAVVALLLALIGIAMNWFRSQ